MRIEVTQAHIDAGKRKRSTKCPVALAIKEALGVQYVMVEDLIHIGRGLLHGHRTPDIVCAFICAFDRNQSGLMPFSFDLEIE